MKTKKLVLCETAREFYDALYEIDAELADKFAKTSEELDEKTLSIAEIWADLPHRIEPVVAYGSHVTVRGGKRFLSIGAVYARYETSDAVYLGSIGTLSDIPLPQKG